MKYTNPTKLYKMNSTDPRLKFRYARGLGDLVACFLHSKPVGWLTKLITGKDVPCSSCNARASALNVLVPIPFWKLFFESNEELVETLRKDYIKNGWDANLSDDRKSLSASKKQVTPLPIPSKDFPVSPVPSTSAGDDYSLVSSSEAHTGGFLVKVFIYKHK